MVRTVGCLIAVAPGKSEVALCQIACSGNLVGASAVSLCLWQMVVSKLEVVDNLLEELLVGEFCVGSLFGCLVLIYFLVYPWHLSEHLQELEIEVSAQETHLSLTLCGEVGAQFGIAVLFE